MKFFSPRDLWDGIKHDVAKLVCYNRGHKFDGEIIQIGEWKFQRCSRGCGTEHVISAPDRGTLMTSDIKPRDPTGID